MQPYEIGQLAIQAVVVVGVFLTLYIYYRQLGTMSAQLEASREAATAQNILALIEFLQDSEVRSAREVVRMTLAGKRFESWTSDERREACRVCSTYDAAALIIRMGLVPPKLLVRDWGPSIRHCFEVTRPLVVQMQKPENSGSSYWANFAWLYEQTREEFRESPVPETSSDD
jgi:hypothetical protein